MNPHEMPGTGKDPKPARPITWVIHFELDGFPIEVEPLLTPQQLGGYLKKLRDIGAVPPPRPVDRTPDGAPICPRHRVPLRERSKQGDTWHSHKVIDDQGEVFYCKGYDGPDSPGWQISPAGPGMA